MSVAMVAVGGLALGAVGAVAGADASRHAANVQKDAAANATALDKSQYDQTRADNAGYRARGDAAGNQLSNLLGLGTPGQVNPDGTPVDAITQDYRDLLGRDPYAGEAGIADWQKALAQGQTLDQVRQQIASSAEAQGPHGTYTAPAGTTTDPNFGSLLRKFSTADLNADPVYNSGLQFGLDEGNKAINNRAAAGGSFLSGATLKALSRFGTDYGSTKAADAYSRFTGDQTNTYNRLAGVAGTGQQATNQVTAAGQNYAASAGANITGAGNAQAAGIVGGANALNNGISSGYNMYQGNQLMNMIRNPGASGGGGYAGPTSGPTEPYPGFNASIGGP